MKAKDLVAGDRVNVDLTGLYLGLCGRCGETTLMVPGGVCTHCRTPEALVLPDPLFDEGDAIGGSGDHALPAQ
jgi:hypothetical protein